MEAAVTKTLWYADGLRWIGSIFTGAAEHLERTSLELARTDPRVSREAENYMEDVRTRVHIHF
jgi:hypothetical protein